KGVVTSSLPTTTGNDLAIGEIVTYRTTIVAPEEISHQATLTDVLPAGMALVDLQSVAATAGVSTSVGTFGDVLTNAVVRGTGSQVVFAFGTLTNLGSPGAADETITIEYRAVVLNVPANVANSGLTNTATFRWTPAGQSQESIADTETVN